MELSVEQLYPDQVVLLSRTAVLVGVHGAALTNMLWMRPHKGVVVEVMQGPNYHYVNMAHMLGHTHLHVHSSTPDSLAKVITKAMEIVSSKY